MNLLFPSPFTSTHILVGVLVFAIFGIFGFVVYKVIKTEKKATTQRKAMKVGDIVYYHYAAESSIEGVVTAIDGDDVTIQTTKVISMSRVYPVN